MPELCFIYVTAPNKDVANDIAKTILKQRLAACANIYTIQSLYWWENNINEEPECVIIFKTKEELYQEVKNAIEKIHPYKIPCIIRLPIYANDLYHKWILGEINAKET
jgi:periplasmic divalent cation tolerance protein